MDIENQKKLEINEPETLLNRINDPKTLKKVEAIIATQFVQHAAGEIVRGARKTPGHGTPAPPIGHAFVLDSILWVDVERTLAGHNPLGLDPEAVENALIEHPGYVTDGVLKVPGENDRFVIGVDIYEAGIRRWF
jgi:hypothetical protein